MMNERKALGKFASDTQKRGAEIMKAEAVVNSFNFIHVVIAMGVRQFVLQVPWEQFRAD